MKFFPFIFLISTQFLFYDLFKKDELNLLKINGLSNLKIIRILSIVSFAIGILTVLIFYNAASKLKFFYTDIKNQYSDKNKYLAVVTDSGLWLKDEIDDSILIVKATSIKDDYLLNVVINKFDNDFNLINTIQSNQININGKLWIIDDPLVTKKNVTSKEIEQFKFTNKF